VADEDEISVEAAVAVESAGGFDGGAELVVGADQRERGGGGEELGVRRGREELVGVLRVQRLPVESRNDFDSPEAAGQIGGAQDGGDAILQRFDDAGSEPRRRGEGSSNDDGQKRDKPCATDCRVALPGL
jgi:hypothetical protein